MGIYTPGTVTTVNIWSRYIHAIILISIAYHFHKQHRKTKVHNQNEIKNHLHSQFHSMINYEGSITVRIHYKIKSYHLHYNFKLSVPLYTAITASLGEPYQNIL